MQANARLLAAPMGINTQNTSAAVGKALNQEEWVFH